MHTTKISEAQQFDNIQLPTHYEQWHSLQSTTVHSSTQDGEGHSLHPTIVKSSTYYENWHSPHPQQCAEIWDSTIRREVDGSYAVSVPFQLGLVLEDNATVHYVPESIVKKRGGSRLLTFEDLSEINDKEWIFPIDGRVYDLYPQDLPFSEIIHNISTCKEIRHKPINQYQFRYYNVSSTVCSTKLSETKPDVVVVVKSGVKNFDRRIRLRNFFKINKDLHNFTVGLVFSLGLPRRSQTDVLQRDGFIVNFGKPDSDEQNNATEKQLNAEIIENGDVILGAYEDTYFNLTYKMFHSYQWAAHFCKHLKPLFLFMDDEYQLNFTYMQENFMSKSREERNNLAVGSVQCRMPVLRNAGPTSWSYKWDLSKREMPWHRFACYPSGFATLMGYNVVSNISLVMPFTKFVHVDDAYLGMVLHKSRVTIKHDGNMHPYGTKNKSNKFVYKF